MDDFGPDNAFWIDGEWVHFDSFDWDDGADDPANHLARLEQEAAFRRVFPGANVKMLPFFRRLRATMRDYFDATGRHLRTCGELGELFGALTCGMSLHRPCAAGSDGRLGNDFIEVKTIGPDATTDKIRIKRQGNFNKLLIVMIDPAYRVRGRLIDRKDIKHQGIKHLSARWQDFENVKTWDTHDFPHPFD